MKKNVLTLTECLLRVTSCTAKFWQKRLTEIENELEGIFKDPNTGSKEDSIELVKSHSSTKEKLENEKYQIKQNLSRLKVYEPGEDTDSISIGNSIVLSINGRETKEVFLESISTGSCTKIISLSSPIGKEIFGKKAGDQGTYLASGIEYFYEIFEVKPFSEAKKIFKKTPVVSEEVPIVEEVPVVSEQKDSMICF